MKIALVGVGYWGGKLLRNLVDLLTPQRVVVVDSSPSATAGARRRHPGIGVGSLVQALADDDVGAAVIATPMETHTDLARRALLASKHVFVEKPLALDPVEAAYLAGLADEMGLHLMVGHTFLFSPALERLVQEVRSGRLAPVRRVVSLRLGRPAHLDGASVIWDLGPHDVSMIFHLLDEPLTVVRATAGAARPGYPDRAVLGLEFASGTMAAVTLSGRARTRTRTLTVEAPDRTVVYDDTDPVEPLRSYPSPGSAAGRAHAVTAALLRTASSPQEPLARELQHFLDVIAGTTPCRSGGWFGVRVVEALAAADRSWRDGGAPVEVEPRLDAEVPA